MNHSGLGPITTQNIIDRRNQITLFLSTSKMLLGIDIESIDVIVFVRVLSMLHYVVQGAGRGGRRSCQFPGMRRKVIVTILRINMVKPIFSCIINFWASLFSACLKATLEEGSDYSRSK